MTLSGLHLLLSYKCTFECDHCFVWGSPSQEGTMSLRVIEKILKQGKDLGTVESIYFEGGEPFLYYPILVAGVRKAADLGFGVGLVTNAYWATSPDDAFEWLKPFVGLVQDLSISCDQYHGDDDTQRQAGWARSAAESMGIPAATVTVAQPQEQDAQQAVGQLAAGESAVMFRGRAAEKLAPRTPGERWDRFTECPHEDLRDPGRVHIDPLGNVHICQGISIGNVLHSSLQDICRQYDPESHPVAGPLLTGGPAGLVRQYGVPYSEIYADACHLCYYARTLLRTKFPDILTPDQMYGVFSEQEGGSANK